MLEALSLIPFRRPLLDGSPAHRTPRPPNTGDKLRSGARVRTRRRGHSAAPPAERRLRREGWCRRKLRQLHPLVRRPATLPLRLLSCVVDRSSQREPRDLNAIRRNEANTHALVGVWVWYRERKLELDQHSLAAALKPPSLGSVKGRLVH